MTNTTDIAALLAQCRAGTALDKVRAMMALEKLRAREAIPVILDLVAHEDSGVRSTAACALGTLGDRDTGRVGPVLQGLLDDPDSSVRNDAAESLGFLRYQPARTALERVLLHDEDATPRASAAESLGDLGDPRALPALEAGLRDEDGPVRAYVAMSIGMLGDPRALPALRRQLDIEPRPGTRGDLIAAALRLGDDSAFDDLLDLVALLGRDDDDVPSSRIQVQGALQDLLTHDPPAIVRERADELDRRLAAFDEPLLREFLARLRG